jgi:hypothetical protein
MDIDGNGLITRGDAGFGELRIWVDDNADGVSQADELRSLEAMGVLSLDLSASPTTSKNSGNLFGLVSSYMASDGAVREMADVWFVADRNEGVGTQLSPERSALTLESRVGGLVEALAAFSATGAGVPVPTMPGDGASGQTRTAVAMPVPSLDRGGLVEVLQRFDANGQPLAPAAPVPGIPGIAVAPSVNPVASPEPSFSGVLANGR